jgi:hypothetical protein
LKTNFIKILAWLEEHNLTINYSKTKIIEFRPHQKPPLNIELAMNDIHLEKVSNCTLLGLEIDSHLKWKNHVEKIKSKLSRFTYALFELKLNTDQKTAITAYYAYAHSWLSYGIILWGNSTSMNELFLLQKRCIRIIINIGNMETCKPHFIKLNILTLPALYIFEICKFLRKNITIFEKSIPSNLRVPRQINQNKYKTPHSRLALHQSSPYCAAIKIYNNLPLELRIENNIKIFIKKLKLLLIKKCYYNLNEYYNDKFI